MQFEGHTMILGLHSISYCKEMYLRGDKAGTEMAQCLKVRRWKPFVWFLEESDATGQLRIPKAEFRPIRSGFVPKSQVCFQAMNSEEGMGFAMTSPCTSSQPALMTKSRSS